MLGLQIQGNLERGAKVLDEAGVAYTSIADPGLADQLGVRVIPFTVIVRPDGRLGVSISGGASREMLREQALAMASR